MAKNIDSSKVIALNCSVCSFITQKLERLLSHIELFHARPVDVEIFKCEFCGGLSTSSEFLDEHCEIQHNSTDASNSMTKVFSQTVNDKLARSEDGSRRPLLGKTYDVAPSGDKKDLLFTCDVCRAVLSTEEQLKTHVTEKHQTVSAFAKKKSNMVPLACIDIRQSLLSAPIYIKDQGSYIVDCNRDGVYARIKFYPKFFVKPEADRLLKLLDNSANGNGLGWQQRNSLNRKTGKERGEPRLTCYIGPAYEYAGIRWEENNEWPDDMKALKDTVEAATGHTFNSVLGTLYRNGHDSIGWHSDDEPELGKYPTIASVTFGATRAFEISKPAYQPPYMCVHLGHGDLMVTEGSLQERWKHRVFKAPQIRDKRVNFTFRTVDPTLRKHRVKSSSGKDNNNQKQQPAKTTTSSTSSSNTTAAATTDKSENNLTGSGDEKMESAENGNNTMA